MVDFKTAATYKSARGAVKSGRRPSHPTSDKFRESWKLLRIGLDKPVRGFLESQPDTGTTC